MTPKSFNLRLFLALNLSMVVLLAGCQTIRNVERQATFVTFSPQMEQQLGDQYAQELSKEMEFVDDPTVQQWIDDLGNRLAEHSPETEQTFKFFVTKDESINAFAIPGGYCYIQSGLILAAENEAEVAAVVGHEINHVTMRHGMRSLQRKAGVDALYAAVAGEGGSTVAKMVKDAGGLMAMRTFGRDDEREADKYGVEAMYEAGYNPQGAVTFFQKLVDGDKTTHPGTAGSGVMSFVNQAMSTHPETQERIDNIQAQIADYPGKESLKLDSEDFHKIQSIIRNTLGTAEVPEL